VLVYPGDLFASQIVAGSLMLLGAVGAVVLATTRQRGAPTTSPGRALSPLLAWALGPPMLSYLTVDVTYLFLARYALYTLPAWCLLAAVAIVHAAAPQGSPDAVRAWLSRGQAVGVMVAVVVVGLAGLTAQLNVRRSPLNGEPDFRAAAAIVDAGFQPRDGIVYVGVDRSARLPFGYELRLATPREVFAWRPPQVNGTFVPEPCADPVVCLDGVSRVWVVATNDADDIYRGLPEDQARALRGGFDVTQTRRVADGQVALLVRKPRR
jgi:mannosyltransferase